MSDEQSRDWGAPGGLVIAAGLFAAAFISMAALVAAGAMSSVDSVIASILPGLGGRATISAARIISYLGSLIGAFLIALPLFVWLLRRHQNAAVGLALCFLLAPISLFLKNVIGRLRPTADWLGFEPISTATLSFPSAHAALSAGVYGWLVIVLISSELPRMTRIVGAASLLVVIGLIGLSRLYLGAHFATDVVGGWLLALTGLTLLVAAIRSR